MFGVNQRFGKHCSCHFQNGNCNVAFTRKPKLQIELQSRKPTDKNYRSMSALFEHVLLNIILTNWSVTQERLSSTGLDSINSCVSAETIRYTVRLEMVTIRISETSAIHPTSPGNRIHRIYTSNHNCRVEICLSYHIHLNLKQCETQQYVLVFLFSLGGGEGCIQHFGWEA
jgi:hypothetical protein